MPSTVEGSSCGHNDKEQTKDKKAYAQSTKSTYMQVETWSTC